MAFTVSTNITEPFVATFNATDAGVKRDFLRLFPRTRESYDVGRQHEVLKEVFASPDWKRFGKPWFTQDVVTRIVYRKSPPSRAKPTGRITVCVPYEYEFDVAVSQKEF